MKTLTRRTLMGLSAVLLLTSAHAAGKLAPCIAPVVAPKPVEPVLIVIIDRTAPRATGLNAALAEAVLRASKPGVRLVLWSFGGTGASALPALVHDVRIPKLDAPTNDLKNFASKLLLSDKESAAIETCAMSYVKSLQTDFYERVKVELAMTDGGDPLGASPILATINSALAPFSTNAGSASPTTVLVATDGREHSGLLSFYAKAGEKTSGDELVAKANRLYPTKWSGATFHIAGLGVSENGDLVLLEEMRQVWTKIIKHRGGQVGELSPSSLQKLEGK